METNVYLSQLNYSSNVRKWFPNFTQNITQNGHVYDLLNFSEEIQFIPVQHELPFQNFPPFCRYFNSYFPMVHQQLPVTYSNHYQQNKRLKRLAEETKKKPRKFMFFMLTLVHWTKVTLDYSILQKTFQILPLSLNLRNPSPPPPPLPLLKWSMAYSILQYKLL